MVAANINDVDEFGDLPQNLMERLSQILSRRRIIDSRTMDLFLKAGADTVTTHDCASKFRRPLTVVNSYNTQNSRLRTISKSLL